jgi:Domain of unknown function (DUF4136)
MIKFLPRLLIVPATAGLLASCTTLYVKSDVNQALLGSVHCHSFAWAGAFHGNSPLRNGIANPLNETRLRTAIAAHLGSGGVQADASGADCLVGYGIGSNTVVEGGYPYGPGWGWGYGYGWGWDPYAYREGIIAVDLYDAKSRQPLWHASVPQNLYGAEGAEAQKRIDAAVAAIFTKYPG